MTIDTLQINDREFQKFKESTIVPSMPCVAVVNADGTPISGGAGAAIVEAYTKGYDTGAAVWRNIGAALRPDGTYALKVDTESSSADVVNCLNSVVSLPATTWTQVTFDVKCALILMRLSNVAKSFYYRWHTIVPADLSIYFTLSADSILTFEYPNNLALGGKNLYIYNPDSGAQTLQVFQELLA